MNVRFHSNRNNETQNGWKYGRIDRPIPIILGKGDKDVEKHWFLCEAIWISIGSLDANKLVEFQTTLRGYSLKWYMKDIEPRMQEKSFTLSQVCLNFIVEFKTTPVKATSSL